MGDDRTRVLYVDHVPERGGGQVVLQGILASLDTTRYEPAAACPPNGPIWEFCREHGIPTHDHSLGRNVRQMGRYRLLPQRLGGAARATVATLARLGATVRRFRPHLLHCSTNKDCLLGALVGRATGAKVVWHVHDILDPATVPRVAVTAMRLGAAASAARILGDSRAVTDALAQSGFRRTHLRPVPNGVIVADVAEARPGKLRAELQRSDSVALFGMLGRLCPWKGQHVVLRAISLLPADLPVHFVFIGGDLLSDRGYRAELESLARQLGIEQRLTFTGHREDRLDLLHDLDVVVHASTEPEPFGLVLVEGMLAGKPVIGSDAGGPRDIVVPERTGLLTPPGDAEALAGACLRLLADAAWREELGRRGRERAVTHFSSDRMARDVERVYEELLPRSGARQR